MAENNSNKPAIDYTENSPPAYPALSTTDREGPSSPAAAEIASTVTSEKTDVPVQVTEVVTPQPLRVVPVGTLMTESALVSCPSCCSIVTTKTANVEGAETRYSVDEE